MGEDPVGCAIVGCGAIAESHVSVLPLAGGVPRVVIGSNHTEASDFAARYRIPRVCDDLDSVLSLNEVEAVVIASPSDVHAGQAVAALQAGKHVLCEIPVGLSLAEAESVCKAQEATGLVAMVCHTQRYWPSLVALQAIISERALAVCHVLARMLMRRHESIGWTGRRRTWVDNTLWHHGCHAVDTTLTLLGRPPYSVLAGFGPPFEGTGLAMDGDIIVRSSGNALGAISVSYNSLINASDYLVIADDDSFRIEGGRLFGSQGDVLAGGEPDEMRRAAMIAQDRDFLDAIRKGTTPKTSIRHVLPAMHVLHQAELQRSATYEQCLP